MNRMKLLFTLAIPVLLSQTAQAQTSSRLIGEAHWSNNGAVFNPTDSSSLSYSNGRGGDLTHTLKFDNETTWLYSDSAYNNEFNYIQTFDANNNMTSATTQYWDGINWINSTKSLYFYDASNNLLNKVYQTWGGSNWVNVSNDAYSYNAANQLFADQYQTWSGTAFTPVSQKTYYYDASGNKIQEVDQTYSSTLGVFVYSSRVSYTFSTANQLLSTTNSNWDGVSTWIPVDMTTNTYDTSGDRINQLYQTYNSSTSTWVSNMLRNYSNFTNMMPMTEIDQAWDTTGSGSWDNTRMYTYTYNSNNQMTSSVGESWNIAGFYEFANGDPMANYYYESYSTVTAVKNVVNNGGDANIYPVPAQNMLHIDLTWNVAQSATVSIYDMAGRVVRQLDAPAATQFNCSVSVNSLADGMYVVKVLGTQGQIVKQIVVAH